MIIIRPARHVDLLKSFYNDQLSNGLNHDIVLINSSGTIVSSRKSIKVRNTDNFILNSSSVLSMIWEIISEPFFLDANNNTTSTTWTVNKLRIYEGTTSIILAEPAVTAFSVSPGKSFRFYTDGLIIRSRDEINQPD